MKKSVKTSKKTEAIKVGVVGYGGAFNMGRGHLLEMQKAGMVPTAVCELSEERLKVAQTDFPGIETYTTVAEMLRKSPVKLLAIITPHNTHAKLGIQCLRAGRHVVCEKPMAVTTTECDAMIAAAKEKGLVLSTYHNRHWDGCILEALDRIGRGVIGDIVRVEAHMGGWNKPGDWWRTSRTVSGGILYDWGVHLLEYALQLIPSDIVEVSGFAHNGFWAAKTPWKNDTNEDEAHAVVRFKSGQWLTLTISSIDSRPKHGQLEITGTQGTYILSGDYIEIVTHGKAGEEIATKTRARPGEGWRFYQNVADHLTQGTPLVITPEWARRPIHILDLAVRSAEQGRTLHARYP